MSNIEPVYAHVAAARREFDSSGINSVLSRNLSLGVDVGPNAQTITIIELRHFLLAKVAETPQSRFEFEELEASVRQQLAEDLWGMEDRKLILDICKQEWKSKLLPRAAAEAVESLKCKLHQEVPTGILIDLGFSFERCAGWACPLEDFMLDHAAPLFKDSQLESGLLRRAFNLISAEYQGVLKIAEL